MPVRVRSSVIKEPRTVIKEPRTVCAGPAPVPWARAGAGYAQYGRLPEWQRQRCPGQPAGPGQHCRLAFILLLRGRQ